MPTAKRVLVFRASLAQPVVRIEEGVYQGSRRFPVRSKRGGSSQIREPRERVRPAITTRGL